MPDKWPLANGNWSNAANWNGGTKPAAGDDVFADGRTITIDENVTVVSIRTTQRTGGTVGGGFVLPANTTVTANILAGSSVCITRNDNGLPSTVIGNVTAGSLANFAHGVKNNSSAIINIIGNVTGGGSNVGTTIGAENSGSGTINITGNVSGGSGINAHGARNSWQGIIFVLGNVVSGSNTSRGISNESTGSVFVTGIVTGGNQVGIFNSGSSGTITVTGDVVASGSNGIQSNSGNIVVNGTLTASTGASAILCSVGTLIHNGIAVSAINGRVPCVTNFYLLTPALLTEHRYRTSSESGIGSSRSLYTGGVNLGNPATNNVRSGTVYGASNEFTGTLAVPNPSYVSAGVPTDNTVGTLQHLTLTDLQNTLQTNSSLTAERSITDTNPLTFSWPVSGAVITGQVSINNGTYVNIEGAITFLRTESGRHYYALSYDVNDRPTSEGIARYKFTDGTYTRFTNLRVYPLPDNQSIQEMNDRLPEEPASETTIRNLLNNSPMEAY